MGAKAKARPFAERAVRIRERLSSGDLENAGSWTNLGLVLIRAGLSGEARAPLEKALKARERAVGWDLVRGRIDGSAEDGAPPLIGGADGSMGARPGGG